MNVIELPKILDMIAAPALRENFLLKEGYPIFVDAKRVQQLGAQCLQILLSAKMAWQADECDFILDQPSNDFIEFLRFMGVSVDDLSYITQADHKKV